MIKAEIKRSVETLNGTLNQVKGIKNRADSLKNNAIESQKKANKMYQEVQETVSL